MSSPGVGGFFATIFVTVIEPLVESILAVTVIIMNGTRSEHDIVAPFLMNWHAGSIGRLSPVPSAFLTIIIFAVQLMETISASKVVSDGEGAVPDEKNSIFVMVVVVPFTVRVILMASPTWTFSQVAIMPSR